MLVMKSGAIRYVAAVNPKVVAAANQNADVSINALAVALPVGTFCSSFDKFGSPERDALRFARLFVICYWLLAMDLSYTGSLFLYQ